MYFLDLHTTTKEEMSDIIITIPKTKSGNDLTSRSLLKQATLTCSYVVKVT